MNSLLFNNIWTLDSLTVHLICMQGRHLQVERHKETAGRKRAIDVDVHPAGGHIVRVDSRERAGHSAVVDQRHVTHSRDDSLFHRRRHSPRDGGQHYGCRTG